MLLLCVLLLYVTAKENLKEKQKENRRDIPVESLLTSLQKNKQPENCSNCLAKTARDKPLRRSSTFSVARVLSTGINYYTNPLTLTFNLNDQNHGSSFGYFVESTAVSMTLTKLILITTLASFYSFN